MGDSDGVENCGFHAGLGERFLNDGENIFDVRARGDLRDDAAKLGVEVVLRCDNVRQDNPAIPNDRGGGFIAGGFNAED